MYRALMDDPPQPPPQLPDPSSLRRHWRARAARTPGTLLFETNGQHPAGRSYLFHDPLAIFEPSDESGLLAMFAALDHALDQGHYIAGLLRYEAGYHLQRLANPHTAGEPLAWFGIYPAPETALLPPDPEPPPEPLPLCLAMDLDTDRYTAKIDAIHRYLTSGDTYQVNLTTALQGSFRDDPLTLFHALAARQPAPFTALLCLGQDDHILSFSPELFFRRDPSGQITAKPMKGTAPLAGSGADSPAFAEAVQRHWLAHDEKNRAEHVMIVDLLRNDLGRVCRTGTVHVDRLFEIERYRTLLQMTSTITGQLRPAESLLSLFTALFPSGSMTGAPKHRTMQLIAELEDHPRGVYSGAIGFAAPDGNASFSVAIRTVTLRHGQLRMGVGGGVVADSSPAAERAECWLKSRFLLDATLPFHLLETLLWRGNRFLWLDDHLDRLARSADSLNFRFDPAAIRQQLFAFATPLLGDHRVRLLLDRTGTLTLEAAPFEPWPAALRVILSPEHTWSNDSFLRHKTTVRPLYDSALAQARQAGFDEILFTNQRGELTEGAISSLLLQHRGRWQTPALASGVLPGVARTRLLRSGQVTEAILPLASLEAADALCLANGVRGLAPVASLTLTDGRTLHFAPPASLPTLD